MMTLLMANPRLKKDKDGSGWYTDEKGVSFETLADYYQFEVFGVLLAFGVLFPNTQLMLLFPPIPIKAKYFVIAYGLIELYLGFSRPGSNVAHFAHLGGMLFGYILIKYWNKTSNRFY